ncbi:MAG: BBE domain-containing protein [Bdellovibrionaceae bacterium]|nr:BBE domain-containing protein [Pseudobdellovibrionaceae bacterium]
MKDYHDLLRDYMSGGAYVNYCDLDIKNYAEAYWGVNLPRLMEIKAAHDPENFFKHAQSIPVKS